MLHVGVQFGSFEASLFFFSTNAMFIFWELYFVSILQRVTLFQVMKWVSCTLLAQILHLSSLIQWSTMGSLDSDSSRPTFNTFLDELPDFWQVKDTFEMHPTTFIRDFQSLKFSNLLLEEYQNQRNKLKTVFFSYFLQNETNIVWNPVSHWLKAVLCCGMGLVFKAHAVVWLMWLQTFSQFLKPWLGSCCGHHSGTGYIYSLNNRIESICTELWRNSSGNITWKWLQWIQIWPSEKQTVHLDQIHRCNFYQVQTTSLDSFYQENEYLILSGDLFLVKWPWFVYCFTYPQRSTWFENGWECTMAWRHNISNWMLCFVSKFGI